MQVPYYLFPIGVLLGLVLLGSALRAASEKAQPQFRLSAIAQVLGVPITEGDPAYHLASGPKPNLLFTMFGVTKHDTRVVLSGPWGPYRVTLRVHDKCLRVRLRRVTLHDKDEFSAELVIEPVATRALAEAWVLGNEHLAPVPKSGYPIVAQGQGALGSWFVASPNPQIGQWLGPFVGRLANVAPYFHVVVDGSTLRMPLTRVGLVMIVPQLAPLRDELVTLAGQLSQWR